MPSSDKRRESQRKYRESHKAEAKAYNAARKEEMKAYSVQYRKENAKTLKEQKDEYYQKNSETLKAKVKVWEEKNPDKVKGYKEKHYQDNVEKVKKRAAKWAKENPEKVKSVRVKIKAALVVRKKAQIKKQKGLCDLCKKPLPSSLFLCHWDHNHTTGKMRGVLHPYCNYLVGCIENVFYESALEYLRRHQDG